MTPDFVREVEEWIALDPDPKTAAMLRGWLDEGNEIQLKKSFSGFLQFGTAGLRGPIGPGPSCMNRAVVHRAAAGISSYMQKRGLTSVVIGRDARYGSEDFTEESAQVFSGAGIKVWVLPRPLPTPVLAFAVNALQADVGIMVTASHNPPEDNGYKVYLGGDVDGIRYAGSQIVSPADSEISAEIALIKELHPKASSWEVLNDDIFHQYVKSTAQLARVKASARVVYSAMHGVGTQTLLSTFLEAGFAEPILVKEQAEPNPDFPTVKFPNPEEPGAIDLALKLAREVDADIVIANDPDADRCAAAVNDPNIGWRMLRGDEVGAILGHYIATTMKESCVGKSFANSIVSSSILSKIAKTHKIEFHETLTGFKWLSKIENLRFGYEEALGYAVDPSQVNDKDGISAALLLAQCASELKNEGASITEYLGNIWNTYGYHATEQISIRVNNLSQVDFVLEGLRNQRPQSLASFELTSFEDLLVPSGLLPPTNGIRMYFGDAIRVIVRPSGTEAKLKCYIEVTSAGGSASEIAAVNQNILALKSELIKIITV
ncbi:MAG: phospho-sugar mutase [Actinomycetes bacterium]